MLRSALAVSALLVLATAPVAAQDRMGPLIERLDRIESDLGAVQRRLYRGGPPPPAGTTVAESGDDVVAERRRLADMTVRVAEVEDQLRNLTGRWEEVGFRLKRMEDRLDKLVSDVDFRLAEIERRLATGAVAPGAEDVAPAGVAAAPAQAPPAAPAGSQSLGTIPRAEADAIASAPSAAAPPAPTGPVLPEGTPKEQYDFAFALLRQMEWDKAEAALSAFITAHPEEPLAGNAYYWLGETYYVRGRFEQAAVTFLKAYQSFPKATKAPDNLLKLGMTLARLDKTEEACATLQRLQSEFADAAQTVLGKAEEESRRLSCR